MTGKRHICFLIMATLAFQACVKTVDKVDPGPLSAVDTTQPLKTAASFPVGVAISYTPMLNSASYAAVVKRDFDAVTFDYHMKHGAIVQGDGSFNFTLSDALVNASTGLEIFGHTLGWHQNQNAAYLRSFASGAAVYGPDQLNNTGFEDGLNGWSVFNSGNPSGTAVISAGSGAAEIRSGAGSMKVSNPTAYPGNPWRVQVSSAAFVTSPGKQYSISYWAKAIDAGGSIRLSTGPTAAQYQPDQAIGTAWQQVSWTISATLNSTTFLFDLGQAANTYFIDDVRVREIVSGGEPDPAKLDVALHDFITAIVTRYKSRVRAWDVVNELFADNGALRNNSNTATASDVFVWSHYMGRDYAKKAFQYAAACDPTADLYINDYSLESRPGKLDSLIKMVNELKTGGAKVDGIGTQMHISIYSDKSGISAMIQKLAATGLKIRVSELDVRLSASNAPVTPTAALLASQADMVQYVVGQYNKYIPKAQQAGITVWGLTDNTSWLYNNGADFPLLYDDSFNRKPAYAGFIKGLNGQ